MWMRERLVDAFQQPMTRWCARRRAEDVSGVDPDFDGHAHEQIPRFRSQVSRAAALAVRRPKGGEAAKIATQSATQHTDSSASATTVY